MLYRSRPTACEKGHNKVVLPDALRTHRTKRLSLQPCWFQALAGRKKARTNYSFQRQFNEKPAGKQQRCKAVQSAEQPRRTMLGLRWKNRGIHQPGRVLPGCAAKTCVRVATGLHVVHVHQVTLSAVVFGAIILPQGVAKLCRMFFTKTKKPFLNSRLKRNLLIKSSVTQPEFARRVVSSQLFSAADLKADVTQLKTAIANNH